MVTSEKSCVVHDRNYLSKFHAAINQLRRTNKYNNSVLQKLPKRCCSCQGNIGESSFTMDHLQKLCEEMQPSKKIVKSTKPSDYLILEFPSYLTPDQCREKTGHFIGHNGKNLKRFERAYNIRINIPNGKSRENICEWMNRTRAKNGNDSRNGLWILITNKNHNQRSSNMKNIKEALQYKWEVSEYPWLALEFPSNLTPDQRRNKIHRFVGPNRGNLAYIENRFGVQITVVDETSPWSFREMIIRIQAKQGQNLANNLWLVITAQSLDCNADIIEKIKRRLQDYWKNNNANVTIEKLEPRKTDSFGDDGWIPVKRKDKRNGMQKQVVEEIQAPQRPVVRQISTRKVIPKSRKTK